MDWNNVVSAVATDEGLLVTERSGDGQVGAMPRLMPYSSSPARQRPGLPMQPTANVVYVKYRTVLCTEWLGPVGENAPTQPVICKVTGTQTGTSLDEVKKIATNYLIMIKETCGEGCLNSYWVRVDRLEAKPGYVSQWVPVWKTAATPVWS